LQGCQNAIQVPRKTPLSDRERAICQRLLQFRGSTKLTRRAFAKQVGLGASRLKNYERQAAIVPYSAAARICAAFSLSQRWLATGQGETSDYVYVSPEIERKISPDEPFSAAYDRQLEPGCVLPTRLARLRALGGLLGGGSIKVRTDGVVGAFAGTGSRTALAEVFKATLQELPPHLVWPYYRHLLDASDKFLGYHSHELEKKELANLSESAKQSGVRPLFPQLLARLRIATKERGAKSALAKHLGVPLASVSQWLSGERKPGGETTLRLLKWVEQQK
jgi:transcriptional regulator with XRE-family HTH domain